MGTVDESWNDIQRQTVRIVQESTERLNLVIDTVPSGDYEHWLHDLHSPGASMLSAINLLLDEAEFTPIHLDIDRVKILREKIIALRAAIDELAAERHGLSGEISS
jgi:hypothetical protein